MIDFHCLGCNKLLGRLEGNAEIKCPRCKVTTTKRGDIVTAVAPLANKEWRGIIGSSK